MRRPEKVRDDLGLSIFHFSFFIFHFAMLYPARVLRYERSTPQSLIRSSMLLVALTCLPATHLHAQEEYQRPVDSAPQALDIGAEYVTPLVQRPVPRAAWWQLVDVVLLLFALAASTLIVLRGRSRKALIGLTIGCLLYFGFFREGCICPIGAIQNVTLALFTPDYAVAYVVILFFFLPLVWAFFFGRAFCGGVCPLGAIQDLVVLKPVQVPRRLDWALGRLKYVYLGLAIWFVLQDDASRDFIICRFDPFVSLFRRTGSAPMLLLGGGMLVLGTVVGRPYCRYLCPYGVLLGWSSRFAWTGVTITPDEELDCGLCREACPFGAIDKMRAVPADCLYCARCYHSCPQDRLRRGEELLQIELPPSLINASEETGATPQGGSGV
jgi:ferredoxin